MRALIYLSLLLCPTMALFAQTNISGKILDAENGQPLQFATVAVVGQPYGTLSRADGSFTLNLPKDLAPDVMMVASYLGYLAREFQRADLEQTKEISLEPIVVELTAITIVATEEMAEIELGRKERKAQTFYQKNHDQTYQLATRVLNPAGRSGLLSEIKYYFGKAARGGKSVRLNFYAVDPACNCPGAPLHASPIIPEKNKSKWNTVDLSTTQIELPDGDFYVAFEWLGVGAEKTGWLDFSIGMVPVGKTPKLYEKRGGAAWADFTEMGAYRPLVRLKAKVGD